MIPHERELVERLQDKPFALVGINSDRDPEVYARKVEEMGVTWRSAMEGSTSGPIAQRWNVHGWPTIYVLDAKGVIHARDLRGAELDRLVDSLLAEMAKEE